MGIVIGMIILVIIVLILIIVGIIKVKSMEEDEQSTESGLEQTAKSGTGQSGQDGSPNDNASWEDGKGEQLGMGITNDSTIETGFMNEMIDGDDDLFNF